MEEDRAQLNAFPSQPDLWQPSDGRSREEWMQCHGQPPDVCRRTREKIRALKELISAKLLLEHPELTAQTDESVIIMYWFTCRIAELESNKCRH